MPWSLVLLVGGGFALAEGCKKSGLSRAAGQWLADAARNIGSPFLLAVVCTVGAAVATEVTSNVATASVVLPIIRDMVSKKGKVLLTFSNLVHSSTLQALSLEINPLYLMVPVTLACSYAFMLPVATPPNAIVYTATRMKMKDMMSSGVGMNVICVLTNVLLLVSFGEVVFDVHDFPPWAVQAAKDHLLSGA